MSDSDGHHTRGHDDLNRAFDSGTIFSASPQDMERFLCALGTLNIQNDPVRTKAVVRALTINHVQMARTIKELEDTMHRLNAANEKIQSKITILTIVAVIVGVVQAIASVMAISQ